MVEKSIGNIEKTKGIRVEDIFSRERKTQSGKREFEIMGLDGSPLHVELIDDKSILVEEEGGFSFSAWVSPRDSLLRITIVNEIGGEKSKNIFPAKLIEMVLLKWVNVRGVLDFWYFDKGTNITQYTQAKKQGMTSKESAWSTWTGKLLKKLKFSDIKEITESDEGIVVEFLK